MIYCLILLVCVASRALSFCHALDSDRRLARHRIRHSQRPLQSPAADGAGILRPQPHRRIDVPRHQRSQQRAHGARSRHHVHRPNAGHHGSCADGPGEALAVRSRSGFCCRCPVVFVAVRHFGKVIHELYEKIQASLAIAVREGAGKSFRRARRSRLRPGRSGNSRLSTSPIANTSPATSS